MKKELEGSLESILNESKTFEKKFSRADESIRPSKGESDKLLTDSVLALMI